MESFERSRCDMMGLIALEITEAAFLSAALPPKLPANKPFIPRCLCWWSLSVVFAVWGAEGSPSTRGP
ncbi:hypothetical protein EYF80_031205 [Liparis tanakae]|uniref:Uncharacterized protein n=1 Tax=Liparis tanakae TaxID=230148 RepID=A0A4Z2GZQ9_9TELE|nr:hypothetical protein EYF80_031205 [Liparis tanakae]